MKKSFLLILLICLLIIPSCNIPEKITEEMARTIVAETLQAKINFIGSQTPPTPTPTNTEIPTETPTPTITPTPTLEPTATWTMHEKGSAEILILYYHDVVNGRADDPYYQWEFDTVGGPYVPSVEFEQQIRILYEMGYTPIGLSKLVEVLYNGGELPARPVLITFDSTELGQWVNAYPIMKKYGFFGNLMIAANHVDAKASLSSEQIKTMMADGWELGSAGYYGNGLADRTQYGNEIGRSKPRIEEIFGVTVDTFAYPDGYTDPEGEIIVRTSKVYKAAFAGDYGRPKDDNTVSMQNCFYIPRHEILRGMSYNQFFDILPWKEGSISKETMEWTLPTPTPDPAVVQMTKSAAETQMAIDNP